MKMRMGWKSFVLTIGFVRTKTFLTKTHYVYLSMQCVVHEMKNLGKLTKCIEKKIWKCSMVMRVWILLKTLPIAISSSPIIQQSTESHTFVGCREFFHVSEHYLKVRAIRRYAGKERNETVR